MTAIVGAACSSRVLFGCREVGSDRASLVHYASKSRAIKAMVSPNVSAPKREKDPKKRVVIAGMVLVSVFGSGIDTFYDKLLEGESGISLIDRCDASSFSVRFAGQIRDFSSKGFIDGKNDRRLDDCWRYCLVAGKRALEDANLCSKVLENMDRTRIGVLVGTGMGGLTAFSNGVESPVQKGYKKMSPFLIPYSITNMGSALLTIDTGLMGPNYSISTACATANYCFYLAANHIRRGEVDIMVAGGTEAAVIPTGVGGFIACRALSQRNEDPKKASRPWDKDRDGFVMGEGSGIMESLEHAMKRGAYIIAEYLRGAVTCSAHHMTDPLSDGLGVSTCIAKSFEDSGVSPEKSMIGHALGAAGALVKTGWLHPTTNQDNIELDVTTDTVPNCRAIGVVNFFSLRISNSFGFGGHNSVVVFAPFTA
ncbi:hypothetical protein SADUNF_Sadunf01G0068500 [Salix dunnii]|uniref:3-oxoacyl-[acyl-carrier-protein] synthase n=1 Tax=Salix dunnii TaxID=1413687 RepID=A0A835NA87_9ROSI|nr:hypothetical protein SADUNF_Sadunf01G0068500 [Salix dunnii]